ncbi:MAG: hypothetical protein ABIR58_01000, partial [Gemmatimonadaceae bacterium]
MHPIHPLQSSSQLDRGQLNPDQLIPDQPHPGHRHHDQSGRPPADRAFATIVVWSSVVAIGIGVVYWLSRVGLSNPPGPVLRTVALSLFLVAAPFYARFAMSRLRVEYSWMSSYSFLWLAALCMTAVAGRIAGPAGIVVGAVLGLAGVAAFGVLLSRWLRRGSLWANAAIFTGGSAFAVWTSGVVWGRIYKNPLFFENLSVNGMVHHDSLHLASFANMLSTYGVATTGLDGLPYIPYHWGTAWLFAQWSNLIGISVLDFYQLGFPVMMIPFFFGGLLAAATEIRRLRWRVRASSSSDTFPRYDFWSDWRPWTILLLASVGVIPIDAMDSMGVWTSNVVISESYTVGVPAALLLFATTLIFWNTRGRRGTTDAVFLFLVLPLGIVGLGYLKISLMVLGLILLLYAGLRLRLYAQARYVAAGILATAAAFIAYTRVSLPAHNEGLAPLDFLVNFVPRPWWPFFFVVHLLWAWVFVGLRTWREGVRTLADLRVAIAERRLLDAEAVALIAVAGIVPGMVIHIDGGSAFYFSDVQRWFSVTLLIAGADVLLRRRVNARADNAPRDPPLQGAGAGSSRLGRIPAFRAIAIVFAIPFAVSMALNALRWPMQMLRENAATRRALYPAEGTAAMIPGAAGLPRLTDPAVLQPALRTSRNFPVLDQLQSLSELPLSERRRTALFIPQSETLYWRILSRPGACTFAPFVAPALSGIAMIDGM